MKPTYEEVIQACDDSIAHWGRLATGTNAKDEGISSKGCALCAAFVRRSSSCGGCPVAEKTGERDCGGSPYIDAYRARFMGDDNLSFPHAALEMRDFLIEAKAEYIAKYESKAAEDGLYPVGTLVRAESPDYPCCGLTGTVLRTDASDYPYLVHFPALPAGKGHSKDQKCFWLRKNSVAKVDDTGRRALTVEECAYLLFGDGTISQATKFHSAFIEEHIAQGNGFTTYESAERERDRRAVLQKLRAMPGAREEFRMGRKNYYITYSHNLGDLRILGVTDVEFLGSHVYFDTEDQAQAAIDALGDKLEKLR